MANDKSKTVNESTTRLVKQEIVDGEVYLYDADGVFLCQGASAVAAAERFGQLNSGDATVECENGKKYRIDSGKISNSSQSIVL